MEPLTKRGFTVFCGCLQKESFPWFQDNPLAVPIQLDVTSDKIVAEAYKKVSSWLAGGKSKQKRHFHALVNNAGYVKCARAVLSVEIRPHAVSLLLELLDLDQ